MKSARNNPRTRIGWSYVTVILAFALATSMIVAPWVSAEEPGGESSPEASEPALAPDPPEEPTEVPTDDPAAEEPTETPTDESTAEPTELPTDEPTVEPTELPTEEPTVVPTEVATEEQTDVPTEESTEEPTEVPTNEPTAEPTRESTPEPTTEPTIEPTPVVIWNQPEPVMCVSLADGAFGLAYQESQTYRCSTYVSVTSDIDMPADMGIAWTLNIDFPDSYYLELPAGSPANVEHQEPGTFVLRHPWQQSNVQQVEFDLVVTRTTCAEGDHVLSVQAAPNISTTSDAEIHREGVQPAATTVITSYLPNAESPSVSMTPVDFGSLKWQGDSWGTAYGTGIVTVTNDSPCAISQAQLVQIEVTANSPGLQPVIIAVNGDGDALLPLPAGNASHATIAEVPVGFDGSAQIEVVFELTPAEDVDAGEHRFGFEVTVTAAP